VPTLPVLTWSEGRSWESTGDTGKAVCAGGEKRLEGEEGGCPAQQGGCSSGSQ